MRNDVSRERAHIFFSGSVQGVGFRYSAERVAASLGLTGWVRNCSDGRVEAVCEGPRDSIQAFLRKLDDIFGVYIRDRSIDWSNATGEFAGFDIRF